MKHAVEEIHYANGEHSTRLIDAHDTQEDIEEHAERFSYYLDVFEDKAEAERYLKAIRGGINYERRRL